MLNIYVDSDGCPVKDEVVKVALRYDLKVYFVANKFIQIPKNPNFEMVIVPGGFDVADDWIANHVEELDIVITADIILADRCVKQKAKVIGNKGQEFTEDNIGAAVANREMMQNLRNMGVVSGGPAPMAKQHRSQFLSTLDTVIQRIKRTKSMVLKS